MEANTSQLQFWDSEDESEPQIKMDELDSVHIWSLAVHQFDTKRWRAGWRPWHKGD